MRNNVARALIALSLFGVIAPLTTAGACNPAPPGNSQQEEDDGDDD